jgi:thiol-disulfide isomerase/thioredoxin
MTVLASLAVAVGLLCLLDLLLTVGVIRRLREHTELIGQLRQQGNSGPSLRAGFQVGKFEASTVDGGLVNSESLGQDSVVGFFKTGCAPCEDALPRFVEYAQASTLGRDALLAVVVGEDDEVTEKVAALTPAAQVVVERLNGPLSMALSVEAFPTFMRIGPDQRVSLVAYEPSGVMLEPVA